MQPKTKVCTRCKKRKKLKQFYPAKRGKLKLSGYCKKCSYEYKVERYSDGRNKQWDKAKRENLKAEFLEAYGGACACCKEDKPAFLTIDHIFDDGEDHRKELRPNRRRGGSSVEIYRNLKKLGWPKDYV